MKTMYIGVSAHLTHCSAWIRNFIPYHLSPFGYMKYNQWRHWLALIIIIQTMWFIHQHPTWQGAKLSVMLNTTKTNKLLASAHYWLVYNLFCQKSNKLFTLNFPNWKWIVKNGFCLPYYWITKTGCRLAMMYKQSDALIIYWINWCMYSRLTELITFYMFYLKFLLHWPLQEFFLSFLISTKTNAAMKKVQPLLNGHQCQEINYQNWLDLKLMHNIILLNPTDLIIKIHIYLVVTFLRWCDNSWAKWGHTIL